MESHALPSELLYDAQGVLTDGLYSGHFVAADRESGGVLRKSGSSLFGGDGGYVYFGRLFGNRPSITMHFEVQRQDAADPHPVFGEIEHAAYALDGLANPNGAELHGAMEGGEPLTLSLRLLR